MKSFKEQHLALQQISEYMDMVESIAKVGRQASQMLGKNFIARQNKEIQDIVQNCCMIAAENNLDYDVNLDEYNYDYYGPRNPAVLSLEQYISNLQHSDYNEAASVLYSYSDPALESMIKNESENNYWEGDSEAFNPNVSHFKFNGMNNRLVNYDYKNTKPYNVSIDSESQEEIEWLSSGNSSLC